MFHISLSVFSQDEEKKKKKKLRLEMHDQQIFIDGEEVSAFLSHFNGEAGRKS